MTASNNVNEVVNSAAGRAVLAFTIGQEEYALDLLAVQELRGYEQVTALPTAPEHVKGVINLRGAIVPIVDLRLALGQARPSYNALTVVVIASVRTLVVGLVVDGVSDVVVLEQQQRREAPRLGAGEIHFMTELGIVDERLLILIDLPLLFASYGMAAIDKLAA